MRFTERWAMWLSSYCSIFFFSDRDWSTVPACWPLGTRIACSHELKNEDTSWQEIQSVSMPWLNPQFLFAPVTVPMPLAWLSAWFMGTSAGLCVHNTSVSMTKYPAKVNLKEEMFVLAHCFRGFSPWSRDTISGLRWGWISGMVSPSYSHHGIQETEEKKVQQQQKCP